MSYEPCMRCGSRNVTRERRVDGDTLCGDCGYKLKSTAWDFEPERLAGLSRTFYEFSISVASPGHVFTFGIDDKIPTDAIGESATGKNTIIRARLHSAVDELMDSLK